MKRLKQNCKYIDNRLYMTEYFEGGVIDSVIADRVKYAPALNYDDLYIKYPAFIQNGNGDHQLLVEYDDCIVIIFHGNKQGIIHPSTKQVILDYLTNPSILKPVYLTCCYSHYYRKYNPELSEYFITDSIHVNFICIYEDRNFEILNTTHLSTITLDNPNLTQ